MKTRPALAACRASLAQGLLRSAPGSQLDAKGYVTDARDNLLPGLRLEDVEPDLRQGSGNELRTKFRAAHSSSALAVNCFAPFKTNPAALTLDCGGFTSLHFEHKCPHGLEGRTPPNLDVLANGRNGILAIESKCLEPLSSHKAAFAPAYDTKIQDARRETVWFSLMQELTTNPHAYKWLDAAQLIKHAFGIGHTYKDRPATLLYLYWEPLNADAFPVFAQHRAEIARFAASVTGAAIAFTAMSYPALWAAWETHAAPDWLADHVRRLRLRYGVVA